MLKFERNTYYNIIMGDNAAPDDSKWKGEIMVEFSDELGSSLVDLEHEYDDMITTFEKQKARLRNFEPIDDPIDEEDGSKLHARPPSPTPSTSSTVSSKSNKRGGIKGVLASAGLHLRRRVSNKGPTTAQRTSPLFKRREKTSVSSYSDDTGSDVFHHNTRKQHAEDTNSNNSTQRQDIISKTTTLLSNLSPIKGVCRKRGSSATSEEHVLIPPVLIDGELKSEFQYLSPRRQIRYDGAGGKKVSRSNSSSKSNGPVEEKTLRLPRVIKKRGQSPLKALYNATVLNPECKYGKFKDNNNTIRRSST